MSPLVSVIIPTKNSGKFLEACLLSIKEQTYKDIELIVVDNFSTDGTLAIAQKYTNKVFSKGPERSPQRNFAAKQASGEFVLFIDSDMELSPDVVKECLEKIQSSQDIVGVVIPEESFGEGFWAQCKKLERSFYVGVDWMEAARFFKKDIFDKTGGYDERMISAEDWDLSQRIARLGKIDRIQSFIYHNEGKINLLKSIKKKYYYAQEFINYARKSEHSQQATHQTGILARYWLFLSKPKKLLRNPLLGIGMLFMKTCEFAFGGVGYIVVKLKG
jgi:glycosyltransferase involved in cell wall biosynthesis